MSVMNGATQEFKNGLRAQVSPDVYADVCRLALAIIDSLPKDAELGTLTAALMLAATSYAEGASKAGILIRETRAK